jgi:hypothetical protein
MSTFYRIGGAASILLTLGYIALETRRENDAIRPTGVRQLAPLTHI